MSFEMPLAKVTVSSTTYPGSPQVAPASAPAGYLVVNSSPTETIYFSFTGGATDHGVVLPGATVPISYASTKQTMYLRGATAGTALVYVMAAG